MKKRTRVVVSERRNLPYPCDVLDSLSTKSRVHKKKAQQRGHKPYHLPTISS